MKRVQSNEFYMIIHYEIPIYEKMKSYEQSEWVGILEIWMRKQESS